MQAPVLLGLTFAVAAVLACGDSQGPGNGGGPPPPPAVLLKDMDVASLPSPYYHFEYGPAGQISRVSFASDLLQYDVLYQDNRIAELRYSGFGSGDRLQYVYDTAGRVVLVNYVDPRDSIVGRVRLTYDGDRLITLDRERKLVTGLTLEKTLSFSYFADGNLQQIVDHRPAINGQQATTTIDRFEQYDDHINVDAFSLIHNDFFDQVVLLPSVQLQRGNPAREFFTGGSVDYRFDYTYSYDERHRPLLKAGTATILTGPDSGRIVPLSTTYSYY